MSVVNGGDVVTGYFVGSTVDKSRPAIVVSSHVYHTHRPDAVVCFLTTQIAGANAPTDYLLQNWKEAV